MATVQEITLIGSSILVPIVTAVINYKQNKKTQNEIKDELYKQEGEYFLKQSDEYKRLIGLKRYGNIYDIGILTNNIIQY